AGLPPSGRPRAHEVWPPLDATIDAGGRRLEAVVAVVDDEAAPPAPLPLVPAPRARAAAAAAAVAADDEAAGEWHTFKLFGAADRADRVLGAVVAPLVADARAAGVIAQWFFLRYVDGPGRRDH